MKSLNRLFTTLLAAASIATVTGITPNTITVNGIESQSAIAATNNESLRLKAIRIGETADNHYDSGRYQKALDNYAKSRDLFERSGNPIAAQQTQWAVNKSAEMRDANAPAKRSVTTSVSSDESTRLKAVAARIKGDELLASGRPGSAFDSYVTARDLFERSGNPKTAAATQEDINKADKARKGSATPTTRVFTPDTKKSDATIKREARKVHSEAKYELRRDRYDVSITLFSKASALYKQVGYGSKVDDINEDIADAKFDRMIAIAVANYDLTRSEKNVLIRKAKDQNDMYSLGNCDTLPAGDFAIGTRNYRVDRDTDGDGWACERNTIKKDGVQIKLIR